MNYNRAKGIRNSATRLITFFNKVHYVVKDTEHAFSNDENFYPFAVTDKYTMFHLLSISY